MVAVHYTLYQYCKNVMLTKKVSEFITNNLPLPENSTVIAAVSGGADSVCLLDILVSLADTLKITVEAAHINHNLRGEESDGDEEYVRTLCDRYAIPLYAVSIDVKAMAAGLSLEDAARRARYDFFEKLSKDENTFIATAHTQNDNAETFFINLLRGSGGRGLCGIPLTRNNIIRPLMCCTRDEIVKHLERKGIPYRTDSTNSDTVFLRNFIRHEIIPVFNTRQGVDIIKSVAKVSENLKRDNACLEKLARECDTDDTQALSKLDDAVLYRVLTSRLEKEYGIILDSVHFDAVKSLLRRKNSRELIRDGVYASVSYGKLRFIKESDRSETEITLNEGENEFYGKRILIKKVKEVYKGLTNYAIDYGKISKGLIAGRRSDGDEFYSASRKCTSKLKKLLINDKIPSDKRESLVIIRDGDGRTVFVEGYGADKRFVADKTSENIICIEIIQ